MISARGGGVTPYNAIILYGEDLPERDTVFRPLGHKRVRISQAEVYDGVRKFVFTILRRAFN